MNPHEFETAFGVDPDTLSLADLRRLDKDARLGAFVRDLYAQWEHECDPIKAVVQIRHYLKQEKP